MKHGVLIFPNQLFKHHPAIHVGDVLISKDIYIVEEFLLFQQYKFHAQKLVLHRASMKAYDSFLTEQGYTTHYIEYKALPDTESIFRQLSSNGITTVHICDVVDNWITKKINKYSVQYNIEVVWYETPMFFNTHAECTEWVETHPKLLMHHFYVSQRKKHNILIDHEDGAMSPVGGSWSYDIDNRKKIPKGTHIPKINFSAITEDEERYVTEAKQYVKQGFPHTYGSSDDFRYAVTHTGAERALVDFIRSRFALFGPYEDAIVQEESFLFHSVLSPYLNIGLLTPQQVVKSALAAKESIPLASLEGFIRQIIGWREFMRLVYVCHGGTMRTKNYWNHTNQLPQTYWTGETGIEPIDTTIKKVLHTAYSHHIERLMILGNYMLLSEYDPHDVYIWFMEMYIDSYDWVMVPNVYGMSQFADGGIFATKPYISASNYVLKMSNYKKGDWTQDWDTKFWNFLLKHEVFFTKNPRMNMLLKVRKKKMNL